MGSPYTKIYQMPEDRYLKITDGAECLRGHEGDNERWRAFIESCFPKIVDIDSVLRDLPWYRKAQNSDAVICSFVKRLVTDNFEKIHIDPGLIYSVWDAYEEDRLDPPTQFLRALDRVSRDVEDYDRGVLLRKLLLDEENTGWSRHQEARPFPFRPTDCFEAILTADEVIELQSACADGGLIPGIIEAIDAGPYFEKRDLMMIRDMLLKLGKNRTYLYSQAWAT